VAGSPWPGPVAHDVPRRAGNRAAWRSHGGGQASISPRRLIRLPRCHAPRPDIRYPESGW